MPSIKFCSQFYGSDHRPLIHLLANHVFFQNKIKLLFNLDHCQDFVGFLVTTIGMAFGSRL